MYAVVTVKYDERTKKEYQTNNEKKTQKHKTCNAIPKRIACTCVWKWKEERECEWDRDNSHNMNGA